MGRGRVWSDIVKCVATIEAKVSFGKVGSGCRATGSIPIRLGLGLGLGLRLGLGIGLVLAIGLELGLVTGLRCKPL